MQTVTSEFKLALTELGAIAPFWSEEDHMYIAHFTLYPRVIYADKDRAKCVQGYKRALKSFIQDRIEGRLSPEAERMTSGRGGARPNSGRPKKPPTKVVRVSAALADWLHKPENQQKTEELMQKES